jgi:hypothetical protein
MNKVAVEFVRHTLLRNPQAETFGEIYDVLSRAACTRSFRNLGYLELAQVGVSFSLLNIANLECLIMEAQKVSSQNGDVPPCGRSAGPVQNIPLP